MRENKSLLKTQSSMKVILNGGKYELDDATIPFQIGFDKLVAEKKPAYILVLDVTKNPFDKKGDLIHTYDNTSERKLFKLEAVQFLQFTRPGIHHLVFILFDELDEDDKKFLLEKITRGTYKNELYFDSIEKLELLGGREICFSEETISIPEEFFAIKPKTGIKKVVWQWVNFWYTFDPIDQCEYRKRSIFAFTTQPIFWLIAFLVRLFLVFLWTIFFIIFKTVALIFGYQPVKFIPYKKRVWYEFLFCYPKQKLDVLDLGEWVYRNFDGDFEEGYYPYKTLAIGKKRIYTPITLAGLIFYFGILLFYLLIVFTYFHKENTINQNLSLFCANVFFAFLFSVIAVSETLPSFKKNETWKIKWNYNDGEKLKWKVGLWIFCTLTGISLLSFVIVQVPWLEIFQMGIKAIVFVVILVLCGGLYFLTKFLLKKVIKIKKNIIEETKIAEKNKKIILKNMRSQWLLKSFDINKLPQKVNLQSIPESLNPVHKFVIKFWQTKAKVCKPYSK